MGDCGITSGTMPHILDARQIGVMRFVLLVCTVLCFNVRQQFCHVGSQMHHCIQRLSYDNFHIVPRINPKIPYQPEILVSARGLMRESRADTGFEG